MNQSKLERQSRRRAREKCVPAICHRFWFQAPCTLRREIWKRFHSENASIIFCPHYAGEFKNVTITSHVIIMIMCRDYRDIILWENIRFQYVFRPRENKKARVFKLLGFEKRFLKAPNSQPKGRNKASFLNPCGVGKLTWLRKWSKMFHHFLLLKPITKRTKAKSKCTNENAIYSTYFCKYM